MSEPSFTVNSEDVLLEPQAKPLIAEKYEKRTYELAYKQRLKKRVFRGVKEVKKAIKKNQKGLVIIAADTHPFDIVSAFPIKCEQANLNYYFVRSKKVLSQACGTKQTAAIAMIQKPEDKEELKEFEKLEKLAKSMQESIDNLIVY